MATDKKKPQKKRPDAHKSGATGTPSAAEKKVAAGPKAEAHKAAAPRPLRAEECPPIPGLEVVGRGILLRPYQPYQLAQVLYERKDLRIVNSRETKTSYALPSGYEVNDSPPLPMNESLNQVLIEESWDRFEAQMGIDSSAAVSNAAFSVSATASWNSRLRSEQEAYYAVRSSFVPLWMLYIPNPTNCIEELLDPDIPVPFSSEHRRDYDEFFRLYGSHYVRGAWVGGKSMLVFTVNKSTQMQKEDIQAGIKASFGGASGSASGSQSKSREKLRSSSQCTVIGKGGDEVQLAAMSSVDQAAYDAWLRTIPNNPQVIELDVAGIWTLVRNQEKAKALAVAYRESVSFEPIRAVFDYGGDLYFIRGATYIHYNRRSKQTSMPEPVTSLIPDLEEYGFERIDDAFRGRSLISPEGEPLDNKLFLLRQNRILRLDLETWKIDEGWPKHLEEVYPGIPFPRVDATLVTGFDSLYFFYGNRYARFNTVTNSFEDGYPQPIARRWVGITFDRIDSAIYWGDGKVYFFKGDMHIRYDLANYRADPGYPKYVIGNYVNDWKFID